MKYIISLLISFLATTSIFAQTDENKDNDHYYQVEITTNYGVILIELYNETPLHRDNMLKLVDYEYYHDMLFHRVIKDFIIQVGDPKSKEQKKFVRYGADEYKYGVKAEIDPQFHHTRGAVAMARKPDAANPDRVSSGSHFYIVQGGNKIDPESLDPNLDNMTRDTYLTSGGAPSLDGQYSIFGHVVSGMDVVDKICELDTDQYDRPIYDAIIENTRVFKKTK